MRITGTSQSNQHGQAAWSRSMMKALLLIRGAADRHDGLQQKQLALAAGAPRARQRTIDMSKGIPS